VIPTLPPRLRNRLAETILAARHDARARRELTALAADGSPAHGWLAGETVHGEALRARARSAARALAARRPARAEDALDAALADAAVLFDAGLFFEVHELLEPHWREASGDAREALRGLIQIAVGYQHRDNGNLRGARSLLAAGAERVRGRAMAGYALAGFAERVRASLGAIGTLTDESIPPFPRRRART
jgi:predicted metal-dependent hydrolase